MPITVRYSADDMSLTQAANAIEHQGNIRELSTASRIALWSRLFHFKMGMTTDCRVCRQGHVERFLHVSPPSSYEEYRTGSFNRVQAHFLPDALKAGDAQCIAAIYRRARTCSQELEVVREYVHDQYPAIGRACRIALANDYLEAMQVYQSLSELLDLEQRFMRVTSLPGTGKVPHRPGRRHSEESRRRCPSDAPWLLDRCDSSHGLRGVDEVLQVHAYRNPKRSRANLNGQGLVHCGEIAQALCERVNRHRNDPDAANAEMKTFLSDWSSPETSVDCIGPTEAGRLLRMTMSMQAKEVAMPVAAEEFGRAILAIAGTMDVRSARAFPLTTLMLKSTSAGHGMSLILIRDHNKLKVSLHDPNFSGNDMHIKIRLNDENDISLLDGLTLNDFMPEDAAIQAHYRWNRADLLAAYCGSYPGVNIYRLDERFMIGHVCCFAGHGIGSQIAQAGLALSTGNAAHLEKLVEHLRSQPVDPTYLRRELEKAISLNTKRLQDGLITAMQYYKTSGLNAYAQLIALAGIQNQNLLEELIPYILKAIVSETIGKFGFCVLMDWKIFLKNVPQLQLGYAKQLIPKAPRLGQ